MDDDRLQAAEQERDAARAALRDAVHHLGRHHGCLHVTENPAMQAFYARAHGGDLSDAFAAFGTMGRRSPQEIAAAEMREIVRASEQRADALRDRLVRFIAVDLYELGYDRDEAWWWHDQVALALGRIVLEFPIGAAGE